MTKAVLIINGKSENNDVLKTKTIVAKKLIIHSGDEKNMLGIYGEAARNGVLVFEDAVITDTPPYYPKESNLKMNAENTGKIFTQIEIPAQFHGGIEAWNKYIMKIIETNLNSFIKNKEQGTAIIKFIVNIDGSVSDVHATSMPGTMLSKVGIDAIKKGPKWIAAKQNDHAVASYFEQPITFKIDDKPVVKNEPQ